MKESGYKFQIEQELIKHNWGISSIDISSEWWDDESWKVEYNYDKLIVFYLSFIVDPQFENPRKKGQGIYEIKASSEFPTNWNDDSNRISSISMTKRKFELKLKEFIDDLEKYKKTTAKKTYSNSNFRHASPHSQMLYAI